MIFATQRPSRDIVKGVIDTNFSGRVALRVVRPIDSRLILDESGAETLLGRGDLLYKDIGDPSDCKDVRDADGAGRIVR